MTVALLDQPVRGVRNKRTPPLSKKSRDPIEKWEFKYDAHSMQFGVRIVTEGWDRKKTAERLAEEIQKKYGLGIRVILKNLHYVMTREFGVDIHGSVIRTF